MAADRHQYLVLGASGFIGQALLHALGPQRALGTYARQPFAGGIAFDATHHRVRDLLRSVDRAFTHAVVLMAQARIDDCARNPDRTWAVNVRAAIQAIDDLQAAGVMPIFASTDFVFDGRQGFYSDDAPVNPVTTYGRHKAAVELYCRALPRPCLVLRFSKVVGMTAETHSLIGEWLRAIPRGETLRCAHDQRISPVGVEDLVRAIQRAAEAGLTGLYNAGGTRSYSRLELIEVLSRKLRAAGVPIPKIEPCSIRDFAFAEERPLDTSLDSSRLYHAIGYRFRDMETYCEEVARLYSFSESVQMPAADCLR